MTRRSISRAVSLATIQVVLLGHATAQVPSPRPKPRSVGRSDPRPMEKKHVTGTVLIASTRRVSCESTATSGSHWTPVTRVVTLSLAAISWWRYRPTAMPAGRGTVDVRAGVQDVLSIKLASATGPSEAPPIRLPAGASFLCACLARPSSSAA